ncbi:AlpA family phage regulatory protein [Vibrio parahaemolyticus]
MEKTELSRSAIYRKMNDDAFPKSVNLGDRAVAWVESERLLGGEHSIDTLM